MGEKTTKKLSSDLLEVSMTTKKTIHREQLLAEISKLEAYLSDLKKDLAVLDEKG